MPPTAHLHVHLESAIRWTTLAELASAHGIAFPTHLHSGHTYSSFGDFFDQNDLVRRCLQSPEDFRRVAIEFCADQVAQNVRYVEVSFTAAAHGERLGDLSMPLASVLDGLAEGGERYGLAWRVILDTSRRRSVDRAWRTLELARRYADAGVVAIGLAGDEAFAAAPFADVFAAARDAGLHIVHHAGEAAGADSIREAIHSGLAERIGHGIRVLDDPDLVDEVRDRGIALEICPSSNVALGFVPSMMEHPLPRLIEAGLTVTLNTDIPQMIHTDLPTEYERVATTFGYGDDVLADFARTSVSASFAPAAAKRRLEQEIDGWSRSPS